MTKISVGGIKLDLKTKKYVFDGVEVILTGRTAVRQVKSRSARVQDRVDKKHEIEPADNEMGSWKKWVRIEELYEIQYDQ